MKGFVKINSSTRIFSSASNGQIFSPKRKSLTSTLTLGASPGKRRKLNTNFDINLSFWRKLEGRGGKRTQPGPTDSAVRNLIYSGPDNTIRQQEYIEPDSPGTDYGSRRMEPRLSDDNS